jgi:hypothetical protein
MDHLLAIVKAKLNNSTIVKAKLNNSTIAKAKLNNSTIAKVKRFLILSGQSPMKSS